MPEAAAPSTAQYVAKLLVAAGFREGTFPEAEPLLGAADQVLTLADGMTVCITCLVDAEANPGKQFSLEPARVAEIAKVEPTEVDAVVGFYTLFFDHPVGKHVVQVCNDLPCALRGSDQFLDHACKKLGVDKHQAEHGGATTADGQFTLEAVVCLAACDKAPMMQIDLEYFERLTPEEFDRIIDEMKAKSAS